MNARMIKAMQGYIVFAILYAFYLRGALANTKFDVYYPQNNVRLLACAIRSMSATYCLGRANTTACEPLTCDKCNMASTATDGYSYIVKSKISHIAEVMTNYFERAQVCLGVNSQIEVRFILGANWTGFGVNLWDWSGNKPLRVQLLSPRKFIFDTLLSDVSQGTEGYLDYVIDIEVDYVMTIVCGTNSFKIYLNGVLEWIYDYRLPHGIRFVGIFTWGDGDNVGGLHNVTYTHNTTAAP